MARLLADHVDSSGIDAASGRDLRADAGTGRRTRSVLRDIEMRELKPRPEGPLAVAIDAWCASPSTSSVRTSSRRAIAVGDVDHDGDVDRHRRRGCGSRRRAGRAARDPSGEAVLGAPRLQRLVPRFRARREWRWMGGCRCSSTFPGRAAYWYENPRGRAGRVDAPSRASRGRRASHRCSRT